MFVIKGPSSHPVQPTSTGDGEETRSLSGFVRNLTPYTSVLPYSKLCQSLYQSSNLLEHRLNPPNKTKTVHLKQATEPMSNCLSERKL